MFHVKRSSYAVVAVDDDGKAHGIAGFYVDHAAVRAVMFAEMDDEVRGHPMLVARVGRALVDVAASMQLPLHASADPMIARSGEYLRFLGFAPITDEVYQWRANR
jgi:hypothetical protein